MSFDIAPKQPSFFNVNSARPQDIESGNRNLFAQNINGSVFFDFGNSFGPRLDLV
jgi:hypothetical protein